MKIFKLKQLLAALPKSQQRDVNSLLKENYKIERIEIPVVTRDSEEPIEFNIVMTKQVKKSYIVGIDGIFDMECD